MIFLDYFIGFSDGGSLGGTYSMTAVGAGSNRLESSKAGRFQIVVASDDDESATATKLKDDYLDTIKISAHLLLSGNNGELDSSAGDVDGEEGEGNVDDDYTSEGNDDGVEITGQDGTRVVVTQTTADIVLAQQKYEQLKHKQRLGREKERERYAKYVKYMQARKQQQQQQQPGLRY